MKLELSEAKLINIIKEELDNFLYDEDEETPRYYLDINYYHIDDIPADQFHPNYPKGSSYGDMGYYFDDMWEYGMDSFEEAKEAARNMILDPGCGIARTEEEPNPAVVSVIYTTPYTPDAKSLFSVANCSQELAQELGIKADEYIETLNKEENIDNMAQNISESRLVNLLASILKENLDAMWSNQALRDYVTNGRDAENIQKVASQLGCSVSQYKETNDSIIVYLASEEGMQVAPNTLETIANWVSRKINGAVLKPRGNEMYTITIPKSYNQDLNDSSKFINAKKDSNKPWTMKDREAVVNPQKVDKKKLKEDVDESFAQTMRNIGSKIQGGFDDFYSGYKIRPEEQVTTVDQALENAGWRVTKKIGEGEYIIRKITGAFANTDRNEGVNGALQAINYFYEKKGSTLRAYVVGTNGGNDPSMAKILIK